MKNNSVTSSAAPIEEQLERQVAGRAGFDLKIQQPDDEQKEDHDRAGVDNDLQKAYDDCVFADEQNRDRHQRSDQGEQRMHRVALDDNAEGGDDRERTEKDVEERRHQWSLPTATTTNAVTRTLNSPSGTSPFQPSRIS